MRARSIGGFVLAAMMCGASASHAALYWTGWVSEENGGPWTFCREWNEAAVGFGCSGSFCDSVRLFCETFPSGMTLDSSTLSNTAWFSEEGALPPGTISTQPTPNQGVCRYHIPGTIDSFRPGVVSAVHCSGSFCDNMQLECELPVKFSGSTAVPATASNCANVGPFSDENGSQDFGPNRYVTSITCEGRFCDRLTYRVCSFNAPF
jgi:hypothetical protein